MSKLYTIVSSDRRKNDVGVGADKELQVDILYGSVKDSRLACSVRIVTTNEGFSISFVPGLALNNEKVKGFMINLPFESSGKG